MKNKIILKLLKLLGIISPQLLVIILYKYIFLPKRSYPKERDRGLLSKATQKSLKIIGSDIKVFEWSGGDKVVLVLHGWNSYALSMRDIISRLINEGYTVISFDAPGHGLSRSKYSGILYADIVGWFISNYKPNIVIGHSIGAFYGLLQINLLKLQFLIEKYVSIAMPNNIKYIIDSSLDIFHNKKINEQFFSMTYKKLGINLDDINLLKVYLESPEFKCLLIHDLNDKVIPYFHSTNLNKCWSNSSLYTTNNMGHNLILKDSQTINKIIEFIKS